MTLTRGFAAILVLIACSSVFTLWEGGRYVRASHRFAREAEQAAYVIGTVRYIGQQVARMRAKTQSAVSADTPRAGLLEQIGAIDADIEESLQQLPSLLSRAERAEWRGVEPHLRAVRSALDRALSAFQSGERREALQALEDARLKSTGFFEALGDFHEFCSNETEAAIANLGHEATWARYVQAAAALLSFLLTLGVAIGVIRLVSAQQRRLTLYMQEIESSNRDLDAFAGRIAHDIKNLLHPVMLAAPLLTKSAEKPDAVRKIADRIGRVSRKANELVDGLLAFARAGGAARKTECASVNDELAAVLEELKPAAEKVDATLHVDAAPALHVACAASLLHVVLLNVVGNAIKFLDGREERVVRITARKAARHCVLTIEDTGPGIAPEAIDNVFEPFFRARDSRAPGSGMGLATVRRIVDAYQGAISLSSTLGAGTRVRVELPLGRPAGTSRRAARASAESSSRTERHEPARLNRE